MRKLVKVIIYFVGHNIFRPLQVGERNFRWSILLEMKIILKSMVSNLSSKYESVQ